MRMKNIKTVFIDLDDTVWWFTENSKVALLHTYECFGISHWCPDYKRFADIYHEKNTELWNLYHYGKIEKDYLVTERFRYVLERIGCDKPLLELSSRMNEEYLDFLSHLKLLVPGSREILEYLAPRYDVNILSNGFKGVQLRKLQSGGIDHLFHRLILSDDAGITKPLPGIFEYALAQCGASASTSVMIGDNYDADVCGAFRVGWRTIYFNLRGTTEPTPCASACVASLADIKEIL